MRKMKHVAFNIRGKRGIFSFPLIICLAYIRKSRTFGNILINSAYDLKLCMCATAHTHTQILAYVSFDFCTSETINVL